MTREAGRQKKDSELEFRMEVFPVCGFEGIYEKSRS